MQLLKLPRYLCSRPPATSTASTASLPRCTTTITATSAPTGAATGTAACTRSTTASTDTTTSAASSSNSSNSSNGNSSTCRTASAAVPQSHFQVGVNVHAAPGSNVTTPEKKENTKNSLRPGQSSPPSRPCSRHLLLHTWPRSKTSCAVDACCYLSVMRMPRYQVLRRSSRSRRLWHSIYESPSFPIQLGPLIWHSDRDPELLSGCCERGGHRDGQREGPSSCTALFAVAAVIAEYPVLLRSKRIIKVRLRNNECNEYLGH